MKEMQFANMGRSMRGKLEVKVMCIETGKMFGSVTQAAKETGVSAGQISRIINGKKERVKGLSFKKI